MLERALSTELTADLGYEKGARSVRARGNSRNGTSSKTVITEDGSLDLAVPRDRNGSIEPQLVPKGMTRFDGFDDKTINLYARGLTVREIQGHVLHLYGIEGSPDLVSQVTEAVHDEVKAWQNRPPDPVYPIVFLGALRAKIRDDGLAKHKAVYAALGLTVDGD